MLAPFELTGTIKEGTLHLHNVPTKLKHLLHKGTYDHEIFLSLEDNIVLQFGIMFDTSKNELTMIEGSLTIINEGGDNEVIDGWSNIGEVWFSPEEYTTFETCNNIAGEENAHKINILVGGPSGYGKTARAQAWAQHHNMNFVRLNVALLRNEQAIFGVAGVVGANGASKTVFNPTEAVERMQEGDTVILLDEINRAHPNILNGTFSLLDDDRRVVLNTPEGNFKIEVGPNTLFVSTANFGLQFVGTFELDSALRKRFGAFLEVGPPPLDVEVKLLCDRLEIERDTAETIVLALDKFRDKELFLEADNKVHNNKLFLEADIDVTTRKALQIAQLVKNGMPLPSAFKISLVNSAPIQIRKDIVDKLRSEGI